MPILLQIALGGALGASARYLLASATTRLVGPDFPWGTFLVNVVGCFGIGLAAGLLFGASDLAPRRFAPFVVPGLLGGFTTFSAFSLDTLKLVEAGQTLTALADVLGSVILSLTAVTLGVLIARQLS